MSHIVSFRIEGLAGRSEVLQLTLNRDTNVFFGVNGSGKTSLLRILHSAMLNDTTILSRVPFAAAEVCVYSQLWDRLFTMSTRKPERTGRLRSTARRSPRSEAEAWSRDYSYGPEEDKPVPWTMKPTRPKQQMRSWAHQFLPTHRLHFPEDEYSTPDPGLYRTQHADDVLDAFFARAVESQWSYYSARVLGLVRAAQERGLARILEAALSTKRNKSPGTAGNALSATAAYDTLKAFLKPQRKATILGTRAAFTKKYEKDRTLQKIAQDIDSIETEIEEAMVSRNKLEELVTRLFSGNKEVQFRDESIEVRTPSGDAIGLASLSSGEKHLLLILVNCLLAEGSSLIIDEPELSMHIDWQLHLIESMRALNPEAQLIFATHSPEIMAGVSEDKIFQI